MKFLGGGLLSAVHLDLNPALITSSEDIDLLVVQLEIENAKIRLINGYGPQEDDDEIKINLFWQSIETEIMCAKEENCLVIIQLDANAKVGKDDIENLSSSKITWWQAVIFETGFTLLRPIPRLGLTESQVQD